MTGWKGTQGPWLAAMSDTHDGRMAVWADGGMGGIEQVCILPPPFVAVKANAEGIAALPQLVEVLLSVPVPGALEPMPEFRARSDKWLKETYDPAMRAAGLLP